MKDYDPGSQGKINRDWISFKEGTHEATQKLRLDTSRVNPVVTKPDYDYDNLAFLFPRNDPSEHVYAMLVSPDDWAVGTPIILKVQITQEDAAQAVMKCDYELFPVLGGVEPILGTYIMDRYVDTSYVSGEMSNALTDGVEIDTSELTGMGKIKLKIYRDDDVYPGDLKVDSICIHYTAYNVVE